MNVLCGQYNCKITRKQNFFSSVIIIIINLWMKKQNNFFSASTIRLLFETKKWKKNQYNHLRFFFTRLIQSDENQSEILGQSQSIDWSQTTKTTTTKSADQKKMAYGKKKADNNQKEWTNDERLNNFIELKVNIFEEKKHHSIIQVTIKRKQGWNQPIFFILLFCFPIDLDMQDFSLSLSGSLYTFFLHIKYDRLKYSTTTRTTNNKNLAINSNP